MLDTNACNVRVGCVQLQEQSGSNKRVICYWSHSVAEAEQAYDKTQGECQAIVWSIMLLRPYFADTLFTVRTGHDSLRGILILTDAYGRLAL